MRTLSRTAVNFCLFLYAISTFLNICVSQAWSGQDFVPGEIIIKVKPAESNNEKTSVFNGNQIKPLFQKPNREYFHAVSGYNDLMNIYLVKVQEGTEIESSETYAKMPDVVYAEPNYIQHICVSPNDPDYIRQWSLPKIQAEPAWGIETGNSGVIVAVIDTGIDYLHEDIQANIWHNPGEIPGNGIDDDGNGYVDDVAGWDFVDASGGADGEDDKIPDNDPMDRHGHGTHVAGIIGAASNNGLGIAGVAWNCKIMPVRAGYKTQSGSGILESDDAALAIVYAAENGARVINLSWGDYHKSNLIADAVQFAADRGALICAAAGNDNSSNLLYPAALENNAVMAIGATDSQDKKASFSNYGSWVHLSAPGTSIYSTYMNNSYATLSGTSMSTPHVAGLAALVISHYSELSPLEIKARIMRSVDISADLDMKNITSGRISAFKSIFTQYQSPYIFSINPNTAHENDLLTLFGDYLGSVQGSSRILFYPGIDAEIISWSSSVIVCKVPQGAQSGKVSVTTSEGLSNELDVTVLASFYDETEMAHEFSGTGTDQGWRADDASWLYHLPFSFPFFGQVYDSVYVCSNGFLDFSNSSSPNLNSSAALKNRIMIAPLWQDLITNGLSQQGEDIYVHSPSSDAVCFRWTAESYETGIPINTDVTLYRDGRIQFNYGPGNAGLSPTIGISSGSGENYNIAGYDGWGQLTEVASVLFTPREQIFSIPLDLGWNLISLPLNPNDNRIGQVIGGIQNGIGSIWGYENGVWHVFDPLNPEISDLEVMKAGYGYWVKTTQQGLKINIHGQMVPLSLSLSSGWNLIGFNSLQSMSTEDALTNIGGEVESMWGYNDEVWYFYDPQNPGFSDIVKIEPGMGYWIDFSLN
jgi:subtilisin family serine protease